MRETRALLALILAALTSCASPDGADRPDLLKRILAPAPPTASQEAVAVPEPSGADSAATVERFVQRGSGAVSPVGAPAVGSPEGAAALNFSNAPVKDVLESVLGEILDLPYAIDPGVQGTLSIQTNDRIPKDAILGALEQAMLYSGLALYRDAAGIYHVAPLEATAQNAALRPAAETRRDPGFGVSILRLEHASASRVSELVKPFVPRIAVISADPARNIILLAGPGPVRANVGDLIRAFDIDEMAGKSIGLYPLDRSEAKAVAGELSELFGVDAKERNSPVRFVPIERLNAVLVIAANSSRLDRAEGWIEKLDKEGVEDDGRRLSVYRLQNVRAIDLAEALGKLFGAAKRERVSAADTSLAPGFAPATISTEAAEGSDGPAQAEQARPAYDGFSLGREGLQVVSDDASNALIVLGTESEHRRILAALRELDIAPLQVLIEATVAEVTLNDDLRFGLQWFFKDGKHQVTLSDFSTGAVSPAFPGFAHVFSDSNAKVVLDALDEITNVRIVSSPQLMVLNNQSAELQVGDQVPVVTRAAVGTGTENAPVINNIEFKDTGVILRVTPRVNAGGLVIIEIEQEVSSVVKTTTSGIDSPTIQRRRIQSRVAVQSGETIALGGLIQDSVTQSESGLPWLSRLPLLGNLFKTNRDTTDRTELLVLLTPRVADNMADTRALTEELKANLTSQDRVRTGLR